MVAAVCGLLCLAVVLVFCQTGAYDFVNFDDDQYVYNEASISIAGSPGTACIYYPSTATPIPIIRSSTYSHMLDCQLFGLRPAGTTR